MAASWSGGEPARPTQAESAPKGLAEPDEGEAPRCLPADERCNGFDDDCDGAIDEGFDLGAACGAGVGACAQEGIRVCNAQGLAECSVRAGEPSQERCGTGIDEDCDGLIDEGFAEQGQPCLVGEGVCLRVSVMQCASEGDALICGEIPGEPAEEICDDLDNDCDGAIDEAFPTLFEPCIEGLGQCQRAGEQICAPDQRGVVCSVAAAEPESAELCETEADEDCDGRIDEGFEIDAPCTVGEGLCMSEGVMVCLPDGTQRCEAEAGEALDEICDEQDNDCDGHTDEGLLYTHEHCGACGDRCEAAGSEGACVFGSCMLLSCPPGQLDANQHFYDGCEARWDETPILHVRAHPGGLPGDGSIERPFPHLTQALEVLSPRERPEPVRLRVQGPIREPGPLEIPDYVMIFGAEPETEIALYPGGETAAIKLRGRFARLENLRLVFRPDGRLAVPGGPLACRASGQRCDAALVWLSGDYSRLESVQIEGNGLCQTGVQMTCDVGCAVEQADISGLTGRCGALLNRDPQRPERVSGVYVGHGPWQSGPTGVSISNTTIADVRAGAGNLTGEHFVEDALTGGDAVGVYLETAWHSRITDIRLSGITGGRGGTPSAHVQIRSRGGQGGRAVGVHLGDVEGTVIDGVEATELTGGAGGDALGYANAGAGGDAMGLHLSQAARHNTFAGNRFERVSGGVGGVVGQVVEGAVPWPADSEAPAEGTAFGVWFEDHLVPNDFSLERPNTLECEPILYRHCEGQVREAIRGFVAASESATTNVGKLVVVRCPGVIIEDNVIGGVRAAAGPDRYEAGRPGPGEAAVGMRIAYSEQARLINNRIFDVRGGEAGRPVHQSPGQAEGGLAIGLLVENSPGAEIEQLLVWGIEGGAGTPGHGLACSGLAGPAVGVAFDFSHGSQMRKAAIGQVRGQLAVGINASNESHLSAPLGFEHLSVTDLRGDSNAFQACLAERLPLCHGGDPERRPSCQFAVNRAGLSPPHIPSMAIRADQVSVLLRDALIYGGTGVFFDGAAETFHTTNASYGGLMLDPHGDLAAEELDEGFCGLALVSGSERIERAANAARCASPQPGPEAECRVEPGFIGPSWFVADERAEAPWALAAGCPQPAAPAQCPAEP